MQGAVSVAIINDYGVSQNELKAAIGDVFTWVTESEGGGGEPLMSSENGSVLKRKIVR